MMKTAAVPSRFDTEALLSRSSLLTFALQGLHNDVEGGSELKGSHIEPVFELALEVASLARQIHQVAR
jgi:hypothetical protein